MSSSTYSNQDGTYSGSASINSISGEWIRIDLPYATILRHFTMTPRNSANHLIQFPKEFQLLGSNDNGTSWTVLSTETGRTPIDVFDVQTMVVNAPVQYKSYAVVITKTNISLAASIGELRLFTESFTVEGGKVTTTAASGLETGYHPTPSGAYDWVHDLRRRSRNLRSECE